MQDAAVRKISKINIRDPRTFTGLMLIAASYIFCWPVIGALGVISAYTDHPSIVAIGGPAVYAFSYLLLGAGIYLAGENCVKAIIQWFMSLVKKVVFVN